METRFKILPIMILILCSSCSMLDHRDFYDQMDNRFDEPMFMPSRDFAVIPGDRGRAFIKDHELMGRVPATASQRENSQYSQSINRELYHLESRLNERDYEEYLAIRDQLGSDYERIYFLRLHPHEKLQYLEARNLIGHQRLLGPREPAAGQFSSEIFLNMDKEQVLRSLGEPSRRDYAGSPESGNERWAYNLSGRVKFIYFEAGQVAGWAEQ